MLWLLITFLVGCVGGFLFYRLKIAAGILVGAMFFVAAFNIITGLAYFPIYAKVFAQIISGAFIGVGINRYNIIQLRQVIKPAIAIVASMVAINIIVGLSIYALSSLDFTTALFCSVPGGVSDMAIISHDMGADTSKVAILQLVRLVSTLALFPAIIKKVEKYMDNSSNASAKSSNNGKNIRDNKTDINDCKDADNNCSINSNNNDNMDNDKDIGYSNNGETSKKDKARKIFCTVIIAAISGIIGYSTGLPAGTLLFSIIGVSGFNIATGKACLPLLVKRFAQIVAGAFIGTSFVRDDLLQFKLLIFPAVILIIGYIILCTLLGIVISRIFKIDITTSLFSTAPAGASDMALIASDLGANGPKVALLQIVRLVGVIAISPWVIKLMQTAYDLIII